MKKSLSTLKEKFGKFELSKKQVKKVNGGQVREQITVCAGSGDTQTCQPSGYYTLSECYANLQGLEDFAGCF